MHGCVIANGRVAFGFLTHPSLGLYRQCGDYLVHQRWCGCWFSDNGWRGSCSRGPAPLGGTPQHWRCPRAGLTWAGTAQSAHPAPHHPGATVEMPEEYVPFLYFYVTIHIDIVTTQHASAEDLVSIIVSNLSSTTQSCLGIRLKFTHGRRHELSTLCASHAASDCKR